MAVATALGRETQSTGAQQANFYNVLYFSVGFPHMYRDHLHSPTYKANA